MAQAVATYLRCQASCSIAPVFTLPGANAGSDYLSPDIMVSFTFDENAAVAGRPGISYASSVNRRGDHGSFSRTDTHISMMAHGPDFKSGLYDTLPTANVDIAPTVARILILNMRSAQGRVLEEALKGGPSVTEYTVLGKTYRSSRKAGLKVKLPTDLDGRAIDPGLTKPYKIFFNSVKIAFVSFLPVRIDHA
jgi:hypothetical protein